MINPSTNETFKTVNFKDLEFHPRADLLPELTKTLLLNDYKVIISQMRSEQHKDKITYFYFTKDEKYFGYVQQSGVNFFNLATSTVRQGHKNHGTGTRVHEQWKQLELKDLDEILKQSETECLTWNLKPTNSLTFRILDYFEVIL